MSIDKVLVTWCERFFGQWVRTEKVQWVTQRVCTAQGLELLCKQVQYRKKCTGEDRWLPDLRNMLTQKSIVLRVERSKLYGDLPISDSELARLHPRRFLDVVKGVGVCNEHEQYAE